MAQAENSRKGWLWRIGVGVAAVTAILMLGVVLAAPSLIERVGASALEQAGFGPAVFKVSRITPGTIEIEDLELGSGPSGEPVVSISQASAKFQLLRLIGGEIDSLIVDGAVVRLSLDDRGRLVHPFRDVVAEGGGSSGDAGAFQLPFRQARLTDSAIEVLTGYGDLRASLEANFDAAAGGEAQLRFEPARIIGLASSLDLASAEVEAQLKPDGTMEGQFRLLGDGAANAVRVDGARIIGRLDSPDWRALAAQPEAGELSVDVEIEARLGAETGVAALSPSTARALEAVRESEALTDFVAALQDALDRAATDLSGVGEAALRLSDGAVQMRLDRLDVEAASGLTIAASAAVEAPLAEEGQVSARWTVKGNAEGLPELVSDGALSAAYGVGDMTQLNGRANLFLSDWNVRGGRVGPISAEIVGRPTDTGLAASISALGEADGQFGDVEIRGAELGFTADAEVSSANRTLTLALPECAQFALGTLRLDAGRLAVEGGSICSHADRSNVILTADASDALALAFDGQLRMARASAQAEDLELAGVPPQIDIVATYAAADNLVRIESFETSGGDMDVIDVAAVRDLKLTASGEVGETLRGSAALQSVQIVDVERPMRFAPLQLAGSAELASERVSFDGAVSGAGRALAAGEGTHDLNAGQGALSFDTGPLGFTALSEQLTELAPALRSFIRRSQGEAEAKGRIAWGPDGLKSSGFAALRALGAETTIGPVMGVDTEAQFSSLLPPATTGPQRMTIASIDAGFLQLTDGRIAYRFDQDGDLVIDDATWAWAGGEVGLAESRVALDGAAISAPLRIDGVELSALFELLKVEGLTGEGSVSGVFPVRVEDGEVRVDDGQLSADDAGVLRYTGPKAAGLLGVDEEQSELLFGALSNFRYTGLALTLNGSLNETVVVRLTLDGANPDFLQGYPFRINLNTRADISQLIAPPD